MDLCVSDWKLTSKETSDVVPVGYGTSVCSCKDRSRGTGRREYAVSNDKSGGSKRQELTREVLEPARYEI